MYNTEIGLFILQKKAFTVPFKKDIQHRIQGSKGARPKVSLKKFNLGLPHVYLSGFQFVKVDIFAIWIVEIPLV